MRNFMRMLVVAGVLALAAAPLLAQGADPIGVLKSNASMKEKGDACRELSLKGGPEAVPALAALLTDEQLSHMARYALEPMPCPEAGQALRDALGKVKGRLQVGVISSLAIRKDKQAVPAIVALLSAEDPETAQAAARALGTIGTPEAVKALEDAVGQADVAPVTLLARCDGLLDCAEALIETGQREQAVAMYDRLRGLPNAAPQVRAAALRGAVLARGGEQGLPPLLEAIRGEDDVLFDAALRTARELGGDDAVTKGLAGALAALEPGRKIRLMQALGERGGDASGPAILAEMKVGSTEVRVAAIRALARVAYAPALDEIALLASAEDADLAAAARDAMSYFPNKGGDAALVAMSKSERPELRRTAVELIGQGGLENPVELLMKATGDADESVRIAALKGVQNYTGLDQLQQLVERLLKAGSPAESQAAEKAIESLEKRQEQMPAGGVTIQKAVYGAATDGPSADVTAKVAEIVQSGSLSVDASNANFGDTAPGIVKKLVVDYTVNSVSFSKTAAENETLKLTTSSAPPVVVDTLCQALGKAQGDAKPAVLRLLGNTGSPKALEMVRAAAESNDTSVKDAALRVLCEWPAPEALPVLMGLVKSSPDPTLKVLALRGSVRLLRQGQIETAEGLQRYGELMALAGAPDEKKTVLSGLAQVADAGAFDLVLRQFDDDDVKAEAVQAAATIAKALGKTAREDTAFSNGKDMNGWEADSEFWSFKDGAIVGHGEKAIPRNMFAWSPVEVRDFYLVVDVKLEPNTANGGIQFRSKKIDEQGAALGYQADMGQDVWGRLYHERGRGKLFWDGRAEAAVKPGDWNRYEILAVGPAIWTAINGKLGVALLDTSPDAERSGLCAFQIHAGPPPTASYRVVKLVHDPKIELGDIPADTLIGELRSPDAQQ